MPGHKPDAETHARTTPVCPSCGTKGRTVTAVTVESLVTDTAKGRVGRADGFRFCAEPACDVGYYRPETGDVIARGEVKVRIGQKEASPPRPVCYCFDHTAEEIEDEVARTGTSRVPDEIAEKCRQGLDRCEETNPQGACCLGNVRKALKDAQAQVGKDHAIPKDRRKAGALASAGAVAFAVAASACCWLPLLLVGLGVSGGALSASFEAWRPILLPVTFGLLGMAFYLSYRKPKASEVNDNTEPDCCADRTEDKGACCTTNVSGRFSLKKLNRVALWAVTALVLAFAFFPNYVGYLLGGGDSLAARSDLDKLVVRIDGMTCEACAATIAGALREAPGVAAAEVNYERREAVVGVPKGQEADRTAILAAIAGVGNYSGRFVDQTVWTLGISGMTCEGCAAGLQATLADLPGASGAAVDFASGKATVTAAPAVTEDVLRKAVAGAGFSATSVVHEEI